jgi:heme-degrading monooxygenase HmoA
MIGVYVRFSFDQDLDEQKLRNIAEGASPQFEGMPGLRSKAFTFDSGKREACNFYVWNSEEAARNFYNEEMLTRITSIYGVRPSIEYAEIASLVDNGVPANG